MQWRALGRRGRRATWTIVGDPAQRSWDDRAEAEEARRAATGGKAEKRFVFNTNYRTPAEVVALADDVLRTHRAAATAAPTQCDPPASSPRSSTQQAISTPRSYGRSPQLLGAVDGTVGVVGPVATTPRLAALVVPLNPGRVRCVSSLEAKGLEFDARRRRVTRRARGRGGDRRTSALRRPDPGHPAARSWSRRTPPTSRRRGSHLGSVEPAVVG